MTDHKPISHLPHLFKKEAKQNNSPSDMDGLLMYAACLKEQYADNIYRIRSTHCLQFICKNSFLNSYELATTQISLSANK